jgi:hypothetical protein
MTYKVLVPDGVDWQVTMRQCDQWIKSTWPDLSHAFIGNEDWDCRLSFMNAFLIYEFKDVKQATLFKLAWGGQ